MRTVSAAVGTRPSDHFAALLHTPDPASHTFDAPPLGAAVTRTTAWSSTPALVARTVVVPGATPVTTPVDGFTVAIDALPVVHAIVRPVRTPPMESNV